MPSLRRSPRRKSNGIDHPSQSGIQNATNSLNENIPDLIRTSNRPDLENSATINNEPMHSLGQNRHLNAEIRSKINSLYDELVDWYGTDIYRLIELLIQKMESPANKNDLSTNIHNMYAFINLNSVRTFFILKRALDRGTLDLSSTAGRNNLLVWMSTCLHVVVPNHNKFLKLIHSFNHISLTNSQIIIPDVEQCRKFSLLECDSLKFVSSIAKLAKYHKNPQNGESTSEEDSYLNSLLNDFITSYHDRKGTFLLYCG